MTGSTPERGTGPRCDALVQGGYASYPCILAQGHAGPQYDQGEQADPEPHYAVEVPASVRAWQAWRGRQNNPSAAEVPPGRHEGCGGRLEVRRGAGLPSVVACARCGGVIGEVVGAPRVIHRLPDPLTGDRVLEDAAVIEESQGGLPERLRVLADRLTDGDAMHEVARAAISKRFGDTSEDWDAAAGAAVDAISIWLLEGRR